MSAERIPITMTPREYLAFERAAAEKHEYFDGRLVAMSGASRAHNLIAMNISVSIGAQLKGKPCEAYGSDMRVQTTQRHYVYPDLSVVCGEPEFASAETDILLNPTVIIEILSPSTERYDRGGKFEQYRKMPSLQEYVMIAQDRALVERYQRQGDAWTLHEIDERSGRLILPSVGCEIALLDIYDKVAFPETPSEGAGTET